MRKALAVTLIIVQIVGFSSLYAGLQTLSPQQASAATGPCTAPSTDYGNVQSTINVPSGANGTYYIWSRMKAASGSANSYLIQIDNSYCFNVGGHSSVSTSNWTWVDYQNGSTGSRISVNLSSGSHNIKMIGNKDGVQLDRIIFTQNAQCQPDNITPVQNGPQPGDNCASTADTTEPNVSLTAPANGAEVSGNEDITATASDDESGIDKVEFLINGNVISTDDRDDRSSYTYQWNTASGSFPDGNYVLSARATNKDGLTKTSSTRSVTVKNETVQRKPGDANNDGKVTGIDLSILSTNWGNQNANFDKADFSGDGKVNGQDLSILSTNWGK